MKNYYKILNVEHTSTFDEIKKSYRRLAKKYHPDTNPNNEKAAEVFKEINEAYAVLSDEKKKSDYDMQMFGTPAAGEESGVKAEYRPHPNMKQPDFTSTGSIFEDYFGFNPKSSSPNLKKKNDKVKPMKTNEAFEAIFGKRK